MKRSNIEQLNMAIGQIIESAAVKNGSAKLRYALIRNADYLEPELKRLQKMRAEFEEGLKGFYEDRNSLIEKLGQKQENGQFLIPKEDEEAMKKFEKEIKKLTEKHKPAIDEYEAKMKEFSESIMEEEADIKVYNIPIDLIPDSIDTAHLAILTVNGLIVE